MQSALRTVVLLIGVLLLVVAVVMFGQPNFSTGGPVALAVVGLVTFLIGLFMPAQGLWRRTEGEGAGLANLGDLADEEAAFLPSSFPEVD